jgi:hypothetical protein
MSVQLYGSNKSEGMRKMQAGKQYERIIILLLLADRSDEAKK